MSIHIILPAEPTPTDIEAADVLRKHMAQRLFTCRIEFSIGAATGSERGTEHAKLALETRDSFFVRQFPGDGSLRVLIDGAGRGVLYGAYAWLEHQGWSFHLHGDVWPDRGEPLDLTNFTLARRPRFAWRGMQLWNYWWPGRDSWGFAEYAAYLEQFPKLGLNQFEFPLYWYEPLFTGVAFAGAPMRRLKLSGADVGLARIGGQALAGRGRFTSPDIPEDAPDEERTRAAQDLMRRVFAHAKGLGLRTAVGIEPGNVYLIDPSLLGRLPPEDLYERGLLLQPSSKSGKSLARARLQALFEAFPDVDVYAIWQIETGPARTTAGSPHPDDVAFRARLSHYADRLTPGDFDQLQWLRIAADATAELKPGARLATGGWGAERLMVAADETLPPQMIRATIADYEPEFGLRRNAFAAYEATRSERWHTTWAETDQHLWIQQPKIGSTARVLDELERRGVEGVSQLHWRLLFPDADIYCFARGCWANTGGPDVLRLAWARAKFGASAAEHAVRGIKMLETFNRSVVDRTPDIYHSIWWVGFDCFMGGLLSANRYLDDQGIPAKFVSDFVAPLVESADAADTHLSAAVSAFEDALAQPGSGEQKARIAFWASRAMYSRDLYRAHVRLARACLTVSQANDRASFQAALEELNAPAAEAVVQTFASCLSEGSQPDQGELGLLLTLNVKFLGSIKRFEGALLRIISPGPPAQPRGVLDLTAGAHLPRREYGNYYDLLHVSAGPWIRDADAIHAEPGFGYDLRKGGSGRLSAAASVWTDPERVEMQIHGPPGWQGHLHLYFYQELDWDTPFRAQAVDIDGRRVDHVQDFYGRGPQCDEGLWRDYPVAFPNSGILTLSIVRLGGGDARLSRLVLTT